MLASKCTCKDERCLRVSWKSDAQDGAVSTECLADHIFVGIKGEVAHEEGVRRWVARVAILLGTLVCAVLWCCVIAGSSEVDVSDTTIDLRPLFSIEGSRCIGGLGKFNISEALGAAGVSVSHDASTNKLTELLKLAVQPLVINVPAQIANEQVLDATILTDLGLLSRSSRLFFSLTLLGWLLSIFLAGVTV